MVRVSQLLQAVRAVIGNERAIANASRLLDQRRFEERTVRALANRITEAAARAA